jgi:AcrR family transcriptional regulator
MPARRVSARRRGASAETGAAPGANAAAPVTRLEMVRKAARTHFAAHGYEAASMRDIAADAGIHIATLYFYCSTKEQLLFDVLTESLQEMAEGMHAQISAGGETYAARLAAAIRFHVTFCAARAFPTTIGQVDLKRLTDEHRDAYVTMRDVYEHEVRDLITSGIAAGEFRAVDPKLIALAIIGIGHTVGRWFRSDGPLTAEEISAEYEDLILSSLRATGQETDGHVRG